MRRIGILLFFIGDGGVRQYAQSMIDALMLDKSNKYVVFTAKGDTRYDNLDLEVRKVEVLGEYRVVKKLIDKFFKVNLINLLMVFGIPKPLFFSHEEVSAFEDIDLFISPVTTLYPHFYLKKPFICTIHDLQEHYYPDYFTRKDLVARYFEKRRCGRNASRILCESNHVKNDIVSLLNVEPDKVTVLQAPPPSDFLNQNLSEQILESAKKRYDLPDSYIFYPAQFWFHKNHIRLLDAFKIVSKRYDNLYLVLTGSKQNSYENVLKRAEELDLGRRILQLGYIKYEDLPSIYKMSKMLVMPTLFESVSIPIYEAFALKVPVCSSNVVALPEQVGNAGLLFDPHNPRDMAEKIMKLLEDEELRNVLVNRGYERVKDFNHQAYVNQLKKAIDQIVCQTPK